MMEIFRKKEITMIITTMSFLIAFLPYFFDLPAVDQLSTLTVNWAITVSYVMAIIGLIYMSMINITKLQKKTKGWQYGAITLILVWYMVLAGLGFGTKDMKFSFFYNAIAVSLTALVGGLISFYLVAAGGRTFRARDFRSTFLLIAIIVVLMKNAPIGLIIWPGFGPLGTYTIDVLVAGANRAFKIGTAIAGIALGLRILIGRETMVAEG
jgi:membrane-associated HD superfamily phosphohydrolase